jgi:hypothetical protein
MPVSLDLLDLVDDIEPCGCAAKDSVFVVEPGLDTDEGKKRVNIGRESEMEGGTDSGDDGDEELTRVGVGPGVGHADGVRAVVLDGLIESVTKTGS